MHSVVLGWFGFSAVWFLPLLWRLARAWLPWFAPSERGPIRLWLGFLGVLLASCALEALLTGGTRDALGRVLAGVLAPLPGGRLGAGLAMAVLWLVSLPWLLDFYWSHTIGWADRAFGLGLGGIVTRSRAEAKSATRRHTAGDEAPVSTRAPINPMTPKSGGRYARPTVWKPPAVKRGAAGTRAGGIGGAGRAGSGIGGARVGAEEPAFSVPSMRPAPSARPGGTGRVAPPPASPAMPPVTASPLPPATWRRANPSPAAGTRTVAPPAAPIVRRAGALDAMHGARAASASPAPSAGSASSAASAISAAPPAGAPQPAPPAPAVAPVVVVPASVIPALSAPPAPLAPVTTPPSVNASPNAGRDATASAPGPATPASVQEALRNIEENTAQWTALAGASLKRRAQAMTQAVESGSPRAEAVPPTVAAEKPASSPMTTEKPVLNEPPAVQRAPASTTASPAAPANDLQTTASVPELESTPAAAPVAPLPPLAKPHASEESPPVATQSYAVTATDDDASPPPAANENADAFEPLLASNVVRFPSPATRSTEETAAIIPLPADLSGAPAAPDIAPPPNVSIVAPETAPAIDRAPDTTPAAPEILPANPAALRGHAPTGFEFHAPAASAIDLPALSLLEPGSNGVEPVSEEKLAETGALIEQRLQEFKVPVSVVGASAGPVITRFEIEPALGVRGSQIVNLMKDLSRGLGLTSIRVVETIPGKTCMGLELPNARRQMIRLSEILEAPVYQQSNSKLTLVLGKDITGHPVVTDLARAPHMLVAGTTGSGKSVAINAMIVSLLYEATPEEVRLIMIDPKMLELSVYEGIPHLLAPVVTDMKLAANALNWCVGEMEKRYRLMSAVGVRNLQGFNQKVRDAEKAGKKLGNPFSLTPDAPEPLSTLPLIVVVIDELADLMMVAGKKIEELIARLAQKARAAGIHLILATQRPSVDVITGLIKANIPTRVAFQVSSKIDSRTILDQMGAESLLGQGDMLFLPPGTGYPQRVHGAFVADEEVHRVVEHLKQFGEPQYEEGILDGPAADGPQPDLFGEMPDAEADPLYDEAVAFVVRTRRASISSVQRQLRIGYNRAARLVEQMETAGLVSPMGINGSREVLAPGPAE